MGDLKIKTPIGEVDVLTPLKAIRAKCLDCCCGSSNEVKECTCYKCALYPYRTGHSPNPNRKGKSKGNIEALLKARNVLRQQTEEKQKEAK